MGFKIYNVDNAPHVKDLSYGGRPFVSFTTNGAFHISKRAIQLLHVKLGSKVVFLQDEQYPKDWYIRKEKPGENGFELNNRGKNIYGFKSSSLADIIAKSSLEGMAFGQVRFWLSVSKEGLLQLDVRHPVIASPKLYNRKPVNK